MRLAKKVQRLPSVCAQEHADMIRKLIQTWQGALGITLILRLEAVDRAELRTRLEKGITKLLLPRDSLRPLRR